MKKIILAFGARPNIIKMAPLYDALKKESFSSPVLVHTGQHYDYEMSQAFFVDFKLPDPSFNLEVGSGSHAEQTAMIMQRFEKVLEEVQPELVIVFGDVNSTLACSLTAKKMNIPIAHVEAGLRSFDDSMPEEINRKLTDRLSDLLFTHCQDADNNLKNEGISHVASWKKLSADDEFQIETPFVINVGNIMIDSLKKSLAKIEPSFEKELFSKMGIDRDDDAHTKPFGILTLHRPSNVDSIETLKTILNALNHVAGRVKLIFSVHPRTQQKIDSLSPAFRPHENLFMTNPLNYKEFIALERKAHFVLTDSGGIQEETSYLDVPCLTLRQNTERPVTIEIGTNTLVTVESFPDISLSYLDRKNVKQGEQIPMWDGKTSERIVEVLRKFIS